MGLWLKQAGDAWSFLPANQPIIALDGSAQPYEVVNKWSRQDLADRLGVYWAEDPNPPPTPHHFWTGEWNAVRHGLTVKVTRYYSTPNLDELKASAQAQVNRYRDALIDGGYWFNGNRIQSRPTDRENIAAAGGDAALALLNGAQRNDYKWAGLPDNKDFGWIVQSNQVVLLDAYDVRDMYLCGARLKQAWTMYARQLKDNILAAASLEELQAIDVTEGWPPAGQVPEGVIDPKPILL